MQGGGFAMVFEMVGNPATPKKGLLLHGMALDGSGFEKIVALLADEYTIILPTLDGHHKENKTVFTSLTDQAEKITHYLYENGIEELDFIAGVSLGALIAFEMYKSKQIKVRKYIFDGGPFFAWGRFQKNILRAMFYLPLKGATKNPALAKTLKRMYGGAQPDILRFAAFMEKRDVYNIADTICNIALPQAFEEGEKLIFLYGSREHARGSMKRFRHLSGYELIINDGYKHAQFMYNCAEEYATLLRS
jgi:pimeloyl-ACP methyl ester carboxylesterase